MATFGRGLKFATLGNLDCLGRLVAGLGLGVFDLLDHVVSFEDLAKDNVAAIKPAIGYIRLKYDSKVGGLFSPGDDSGNEELRAIGILSGIGHAYQKLASPSDAWQKVFILRRPFLV